jgi:hypothetical protein
LPHSERGWWLAFWERAEDLGLLPNGPPDNITFVPDEQLAEARRQHMEGWNRSRTEEELDPTLFPSIPEDDEIFSQLLIVTSPIPPKRPA